MTAYVHAIRALTALVFQRLLVPAGMFIGVIALVILIAIAILGIQVSAWWFLLYIIVLPLLAVIAGLGLFGWVMSDRLLPRRLNGDEKAEVLGFADKLIRIAEARATPVPIIGLIVAKDIITRNKQSYVERMIADTSTLKADFQKISKMFA